MQLLWIFFLILIFKDSKTKIIFPTDDDPSNKYEQHFGSCITPYGEDGACVYLQDCKYLFALLSREQLANKTNLLYLRRSQCGHYKKRVLVCCPPGPVKPEIDLFTAKKIDSSKFGATLKKPQAVLPSPEVCESGNFDRIYGGEVTKIDEFPWIAILEYTKPGNRKGHHCGGVLINERFVLTAAHCVIGKSIPTTWKLTGVRLGEWDTSSDRDCELDYCSDPVVDIQIERAITHEEYNPSSINQHHDIALLRLLTTVKYTTWIKPLCLLSTDYLRNSTFEGVPLLISGWGKTEKGTSSNVKLKAQVNGFSLSKCKAIYNKQNIILKNSQICAGGVEGIDSCRGDSGGPLIGFKNDGQQGYYFLVGIVSYGTTTCGLKDWPGVYTRVSSYFEWVKANINIK